MKPIIVLFAMVFLIFINLRNQPHPVVSSNDIRNKARPCVNATNTASADNLQIIDSGNIISGNQSNQDAKNGSSESSQSNLSGKYYSIGFIIL
jgi:hypothetical protein